MKFKQNIVEILLNTTFSLGGMQKSVDTEDIAVKAHKISPNSFKWKKYEDQIDIRKVQTNLYLAKKKKYLDGNEKRGWILTKNGLSIVEKSKSKSSFKLRITKKDKINSEREIQRILNNKSFYNFKNLKIKPSTREIENIFRIDNYTSSENRKKRINTMINLCRSNSEIVKFLEKTKKILKTGA